MRCRLSRQAADCAFHVARQFELRGSADWHGGHPRSSNPWAVEPELQPGAAAAGAQTRDVQQRESEAAAAARRYQLLSKQPAGFCVDLPRGGVGSSSWVGDGAVGHMGEACDHAEICAACEGGGRGRAGFELFGAAACEESKARMRGRGEVPAAAGLLPRRVPACMGEVPLLMMWCFHSWVRCLSCMGAASINGCL
mmetsp:Transcript_3134/g.6284  ORF Transcript_3134/g.6284 Transcript_3134/m.6284 type:complete len:196 (-) Transcript_3134:262-849(-)